MTIGFDADGFSKTSRVHASKKPLTVAKAPSFSRTTSSSRAGQTSTDGRGTNKSDEIKRAAKTPSSQISPVATSVRQSRTGTPTQPSLKSSRAGTPSQIRPTVVNPKFTLNRRAPSRPTSLQSATSASNSAGTEVASPQNFRRQDSPKKEEAEERQDTSADGPAVKTEYEDCPTLEDLNHSIAIKDGEIEKLRSEMQELQTAHERSLEDAEASLLAQYDGSLQSDLDEARSKITELEGAQRSKDEEIHTLRETANHLHERIKAVHERKEQEARESVLSLKGEFQGLQTKHKRELEELEAKAAGRVDVLRTEYDELLRSRDDNIRDFQDLHSKHSRDLEEVKSAALARTEDIQAECEKLKCLQTNHVRELEETKASGSARVEGIQSKYDQLLECRDLEIKEMSDLVQELQEKLEQAHQAQEQMVKDAKSRHDQERRENNLIHERELQDMRIKHELDSEAAKEAYQTELREKAIIQEQTLSGTIKRHELELQDVQTRSEQELAAMRVAYQDELKEDAVKHEQSLSDAAISHQRELQALMDEHQNEIVTFAARLDQASGDAGTNHEQEIQALVEKHKEDIKTMTATHEEELSERASNHQQEVETLTEKYREELEVATSRGEQVSRDQVTKHLQEIEALKVQHRDELKAVMIRGEQDLRDAAMKFQQEKSVITAKHAEELKVHTGSLEHAIKDATTRLEQELREATEHNDQLSLEAARLQKQLDTANAMIGELNNRTQKLQQAIENQNVSHQQELEEVTSRHHKGLQEAATKHEREVEETARKYNERDKATQEHGQEVSDLRRQLETATAEIASLTLTPKCIDTQRDDASKEAAMKHEQDLRNVTLNYEEELDNLRTIYETAVEEVSSLRRRIEDLGVQHDHEVEAIRDEHHTTNGQQTSVDETTIRDIELERAEEAVEMSLLKNKLELAEMQSAHDKESITSLQEVIENLRTQVNDSVANTKLDRDEAAVDMALLSDEVELADLQSRQDEEKIASLEKEIQVLKSEKAILSERLPHTHQQIRGELSLLGKHQADRMAELTALKADMAAESALREQEWKRRAEVWDRFAIELQEMKADLAGTAGKA